VSLSRVNLYHITNDLCKQFTGVLSIFWLATAADATTNGLSKVLGFSGECRSIGEGFRECRIRLLSFTRSSILTCLHAPFTYVGILDGVAPAKIICQQQETVAAFSFIIWLLRTCCILRLCPGETSLFITSRLVLGYVIALVVGCKVSEKHGDTNVWKTSVYHANLFTKGSAMEDGDTIKAKNESSDASTSC
jgi:hypothetical protein